MESAPKTVKNSKNDNKDHRSVYSTAHQSLPKRTEFDAFSKLNDWKRDILTDFIHGDSASIGVSADNINIDKTTVAVALKTDKEFKKCYNLARKVVDAVELMKLEEVSTSTALLTKSTVERIFRLKSLNRERYADRGQVKADVDINITFGNGVNAYDVTTVKEIKNINNNKPMSHAPTVSPDVADIVSKI